MPSSHLISEGEGRGSREANPNLLQLVISFRVILNGNPNYLGEGGGVHTEQRGMTSFRKRCCQLICSFEQLVYMISKVIHYNEY